MKSLLLFPATFALIAASPDVERLDSSTIQIVGADFAIIEPTADITAGVPIPVLSGAWGGLIRATVDPYTDYTVTTYTLVDGADGEDPLREIEEFDLSLTPLQQLDAAVVNVLYWQEQHQQSLDNLGVWEQQLRDIVADQTNGVDYFDLIEALQRAQPGGG